MSPSARRVRQVDSAATEDVTAAGRETRAPAGTGIARSCGR